MPSADAILNGLAAIANDFRGLAVGWHAALVVLAGMLVGGWTPSVRTARLLFVAPLASVGIVAWLAGNPFTGTLFLGLTATLVGAVSGGSSAPVCYDSPAWMTRGAALVVFGATYPHFLRTESPADYLFASPLGLLPCPTLSVVIGLTLLFVNLGSTLWSTALVVAGLLYGAIGVFGLGVDLDWGLFIGTAMLGARLLNDRATWRSVRAHRSERTRPLPGDDLIPEPLGTLTHAITIHSGALAVWPWLVQMGAGRAGWYSYDALDNGRQPSATCVVPELQSVAIDALFPALPGVTQGFKVLDVQPRRVARAWLAGARRCRGRHLGVRARGPGGRSDQADRAGARSPRLPLPRPAIVVVAPSRLRRAFPDAAPAAPRHRTARRVGRRGARPRTHAGTGGTPRMSTTSVIGATARVCHGGCGRGVGRIRGACGCQLVAIWPGRAPPQPPAW